LHRVALLVQDNKKIIIVALRDIAPDEEITYNYMFEFDPDDKVVCECGAPSCTGWMN
jgi:histone-lysine N-methyltransferase SETD1